MLTMVVREHVQMRSSTHQLQHMLGPQGHGDVVLAQRCESSTCAPIKTLCHDCIPFNVVELCKPPHNSPNPGATLPEQLFKRNDSIV